MSRRNLAALAAAVAVAAACSSGGGTPSPAAPSVAPSIAVSIAPASIARTSVASLSPSVPPSAASVCAETADPGALAVSIEDFEFVPATISGRPGQVVAFTNTGFEHHNATVDGGGCATKTLGTAQHDGLVFTIVGSYPFHCTVHPWMTGTIRIAG